MAENKKQIKNTDAANVGREFLKNLLTPIITQLGVIEMYDEEFDITISFETFLGHTFEINSATEGDCFLKIFHIGENDSREFFLKKEEVLLLSIMLQKAEESMSGDE